MSKRITYLNSLFSTIFAGTIFSLNIPATNAQPTIPPFIPRITPTVIPCSQFLQTYFEWEQSSVRNHVSSVVAINNLEGQLVTYSTGELDLNGNTLTGTLKKLFSNRFIPGGFGLQAQPFSVNEPAFVGITLENDGLLTWIERSFNNQTYIYRPVCYSNETVVILGVDHSGVMTLRKTQDPAVN